MGDSIFAHMQVSAADLLPGAALAGFYLMIKVSNSDYSTPGVALTGFYLQIIVELFHYLIPGVALAGFYLNIKIANSDYLIPGVAVAGLYLQILVQLFHYLIPGVALAGCCFRQICIFATRRSTCGITKPWAKLSAEILDSAGPTESV